MITKSGKEKQRLFGSSL